MTNPAPVNNRMRLVNRYRESPRIIATDRSRILRMEQGRARLYPILYHGTCRVVIEKWREGGIQNHRLSLVSSPRHASVFADYRVKDEQSPAGMKRIHLKNNSGREICFYKQEAEYLGLNGEYERLENGRIINAVAFFDRDSLLAEAVEKTLGIHIEPDAQLEGECFDGILLDLKRAPAGTRFGINSLFASLELDMDQGRPNLRVFNPFLWRRNFSVPAPELSSVGAFADMLDLEHHVLSDVDI